MQKTIAFRQRGAALIFGLILMMVLTMLGLAVMQMAKSELLMTRGQSLSSLATAAAEAAVNAQLGTALATITPATNLVDQPVNFPGGFNANVAGIFSIVPQGQSPVPAGGNSFGQFTAFHFDISATTNIDGGFNTTVRQGIYLIAPQ